MSVLIKGFDMPDCCWNCPCLDGEYGECNISRKAIRSDKGRLADCPLVELPNADEFAEEMRTAAKNTDPETSHSTMDDIMCGILCEIGYEEAVAIFDDTPKWYA